jgi:hypothetical protein
MGYNPLVTFYNFRKIEILSVLNRYTSPYLHIKLTEMSAMMINASTESAILQMLASQQDRLLSILAEKYGFDEDEARDTLGEVTSVIRKEVKPKKPNESKEEPKPKGKGKAKGSVAIAIGELVEVKPKKAKTGYLLFCDAARPSARSKLEAEAEEGEKVLAKHVVTLLAAAWKDLDEEDRDMWKERAQSIKAGEGHLLDELTIDLADFEEEIAM